MDTRRKAVLGAPYLGWRRSLAEPPPRPLTARLRPLVRALFNVLAVLAGLGIAAVFYTVPVLAVTAVEVEGAAHLSDAAVRLLADVEGANVLTLDIPAVRQRLLTNPWIADAQVRRRLPAVVEVRIRERTAGAAWQAANGLYYVATDGMILEPAADGPELPVIRDGDRQDVKVGQTVSREPVSLAYRLLEAAPRTMGTKVVAFEHRARDGLVVEADNGWKAAIGDAADLDRKLIVWREVMAAAARQRLAARFVDLRFGDRPYLREGSD